MTHQGEGVGPHRDPAQDSDPAPDSDPAQPQDGPEAPARLRRRPSPRLWAALSCVVVVGLGTALWVDHSDGGGLLGGSQDAAGAGLSAGPDPASTASADPDAFGVEHYFPATDAVDEGAVQARRSTSRQGADCGEVLQGKAASKLGKLGCTGYVGATYTRADGEVLTTVTVLRFKDDGTARKAATALNGAAASSDVTFALPDDPAQDGAEAPVPPAPDALFTRVAAVRGYVTVTSSAFRDGHKPGVLDQDQLAEATRAVAYTAGAQFMWL
ncbi:hypothetical protein [Peterkaempfera bronchialis]|uniref:hypothetical protein n=1 Tax=Peterkaempfera bronchialis TaxID=2126346 RepID=UPI0013B370E5|nr:hypothetical protein [Peterkaempfera bronchialis]